MKRRWGKIVWAGFLALAIPTTSVAGSGPWVAGNNNASVFVGLEGQRIEKLQVQVNGEGDVVDVDSGLLTIGAKAIGTIGVSNRLEVEFQLPWYHVRAVRESGPTCSTLGLSACRPTEGIGIITFRMKGTLADEYYGDPVTVALGGETRFGQLTAETRARITNIGEGTQDFGAFLSIGRTSALGANGFWSAYTEFLTRYRVPNQRKYTLGPGPDRNIPGLEFDWSAQVLLGWNKNVGVGPTVQFYGRPNGFEFGELDLTDIDRFSALKISNMQVGAQLFLRADEHLAFTASYSGTVYARNNPFISVISVGVSHFGLLRKGS